MPSNHHSYQHTWPNMMYWESVPQYLSKQISTTTSTTDYPIHGVTLRITSQTTTNTQTITKTTIQRLPSRPNSDITRICTEQTPCKEEPGYIRALMRESPSVIKQLAELGRTCEHMYPTV